MDLSIIIPIYNEEHNLLPLLEEITSVLRATGRSYEIICVDDGSRDQSYEILRELSRKFASLIVVQLRRNFGQTAAMQAGFDAAQGRVIIPMDADLQYDPADIPKMLDRLNEGYDIVAGWRANRQDKFINRRLPSIIANWLISSTTKVQLHDYGCTLKVMRRELVKEMKLYGELHRFIPAIASFVGARICEVKVNHRARQHGRSKYGLGRSVRVILDLLTVLFMRSYIARPIQVFGLAGLVLGGVGFLICSWLVMEKYLYGIALAERPLLLLGVLLVLVGVQLVSLGLIAEVVARTYHEAQNKPPYYVRCWLHKGKEYNIQPQSGGTSTNFSAQLDMAEIQHGSNSSDT
jgi:glycosyltransferase involved in cell wall biosynthesis